MRSAAAALSKTAVRPVSESDGLACTPAAGTTLLSGPTVSRSRVPRASWASSTSPSGPLPTDGTSIGCRLAAFVVNATSWPFPESAGCDDGATPAMTAPAASVTADTSVVVWLSGPSTTPSSSASRSATNTCAGQFVVHTGYAAAGAMAVSVEV